jgi:prepilin-type N-terminal cleavage/methylation domain-containing protein
MKRSRINKGFSLAEVLMAMGILSIGMIFIAAVFPAGVQFATIATERTIAAAAADEAFVKIRMYAELYSDTPDPNTGFVLSNIGTMCCIFPTNIMTPKYWPMYEFTYPSDPYNNEDKVYCWTAIWRRVPEDPTCRNVQVTVFVCRRAGLNSNYYWYNPSTNMNEPWPFTALKGPSPVPVEITATNGDVHIRIRENVRCPLELAKTFLMEGCTIVDGETGFLYRVLGHVDTDPEIVILDRNFVGIGAGTGIRDVWVIPPPVNGGRNPGIAVFQKVMRF